jgi:hypothetical protein
MGVDVTHLDAVPFPVPVEFFQCLFARGLKLLRFLALDCSQPWVSECGYSFPYEHHITQCIQVSFGQPLAFLAPHRI